MGLGAPFGIGFEIGFDWVCIGFELGLIGLQIGFDWVCFSGARRRFHFHKLLLNLHLRSFGYLANWVCFA